MIKIIILIIEDYALRLCGCPRERLLEILIDF